MTALFVAEVTKATGQLSASSAKNKDRLQRYHSLRRDGDRLQSALPQGPAHLLDPEALALVLLLVMFTHDFCLFFCLVRV